jgi:hypothetical protein
MTMIIDGSAGVTFPNSTVQASAGSVLQVVNATYSTQTSTTSTTFINTPLSATITPKFATSKILIVFTGSGGTTTTAGSFFYTIARGATNILASSSGGNYGYSPSNALYVPIAMNYLDSPATTSATTYNIQFRTDSGIMYFALGNTTSTITLMEIAQ